MYILKYIYILIFIYFIDLIKKNDFSLLGKKKNYMVNFLMKILFFLLCSR